MLLGETKAEALIPPLPHQTTMDGKLGNLLERHAAFLAFVQHRVQDRALAEDLLQSAYLRALQRSGSLRDNGSVVPWFYAILRNAIIDHLRSRTSENNALERWAAELEHSSHAQPTADPFTHDLVCHCIQKLLPVLRPAYAEILSEVDLGRQSLASFAARHSMKPGNAAVRAHRARAALKQELIRTCGVCSVHACLDCTCKPGQANGTSLK